MAFGMNRVELIGRLGADVAVNHLVSGGRVANLSVATDDTYINRQTGEKVDRTEWHRIVTFQDGLIDMLERHARRRAAWSTPRASSRPGAGRRTARAPTASPPRSWSSPVTASSSSTSPTARRSRRNRRTARPRRPRTAAPTTSTTPSPSRRTLRSPSNPGGRASGRPFWCCRLRVPAAASPAPQSPASCPPNRPGSRNRWREYAPRCAASSCHACSIRQPCRVLHSATLRSGRRSE